MSKPIDYCVTLVLYRHRFHKVRALRALRHTVRPLRENGNDMHSQQTQAKHLSNIIDRSTKTNAG